MGKGLDIGTVNLVASAGGGGDKTEFKKQRNVFFESSVDPVTKNFLSQHEIPYVLIKDKYYILGDKAFELANVFNKEVRRPMKDGMISPREIEALPVMKLLIENILGKPTSDKEICYYSIPADPIDNDLNVIYHQEVFNKLLSSLGYAPKTIVEGRALVLAELESDGFTGIGISCGGGMFNICVAFETIPCISFSISRGGDWIDENAAKVLGLNPTRISVLKEKGIDLLNAQSREEEAISIYYRTLISYALDAIKQKFEAAQDLPSFTNPVPLVLAGGTSLAKGFAEIVAQELDRTRFPIPIKEVRPSKEPLNAVARGALIAAMLDES